MDTELHEQRNERRRIKVIDCATQLFQSKGVREVTMDDIAGALRISKRTLYQMFRGKEELVLACVKAGIEADQRRRLEIETDTTDALERLFRNIEYKLVDLRTLHPDYAKDIRRYASVRTYTALCRGDLLDVFRKILQLGCAQGTIRPDIHFEQTTHGLLYLVDGVVESGQFADCSVPDFIFNVLLVYIRGCATDQGRASIDEFIKKHHF